MWIPNSGPFALGFWRSQKSRSFLFDVDPVIKLMQPSQTLCYSSLISRGLKPELIELEMFELGIRNLFPTIEEAWEALDILLGKLSKWSP